MRKQICLLLTVVLLLALAVPAAAYSGVSDWAERYVQQAAGMTLLTPKIEDADLSKNITRLEFAELSVRLYEFLSGQTQTGTAPADSFTDCQDEAALKALALGVAQGMGNGRFAPDRNLSREEAATMLTRVFERVNFEGWTLEKDSEFAGQLSDLTEQKVLFSDDEKISGWAKSSVYFMRSAGILDGMGDGSFAPKGTTTREQAVKIGVMMALNLKTRDYVPKNAVLVDDLGDYSVFASESSGNWIVSLYDAGGKLVTHYEVPAVFKEEAPADILKVSSFRSGIGGTARYYGAAGVYEFSDGTLTQISSRPVKDLVFLRNADGPVILTYTLPNPEITSTGYDADTIISCADGEELVLLSPADGHGIPISGLEARDTAVLFYSDIPQGMGHDDRYSYLLTGAPNGGTGKPGILVLSFEAGRPEVMEGFSYADPEAYQAIYIRREQQRLDDLGLGVK